MRDPQTLPTGLRVGPGTIPGLQKGSPGASLTHRGATARGGRAGAEPDSRDSREERKFSSHTLGALHLLLLLTTPWGASPFHTRANRASAGSCSFAGSFSGARTRPQGHSRACPVLRRGRRAVAGRSGAEQFG